MWDEGLAPHDRARGERGVGMPETYVTAALSLLQTPLRRPTADGDLPKITQRTGRGQRLSRGALWPAARAPSHSPVGLLRKGGRTEFPRPLWVPIAGGARPCLGPSPSSFHTEALPASTQLCYPHTPALRRKQPLLSALLEWLFGGSAK